MRETLRRLAAAGKTVFVSSHLLAEVRVLADVVGIIAAGRLVREGTLDSMLRDQGVVRVRVPRAQRAAGARRARAGRAGSRRDRRRGDEDAWLAVHVEPNRAGEVNRLLAEAGIYASGLESGTDLEDAVPRADRRRRAVRARAASASRSPDSRGAAQSAAGGVGMRIFFAGLRKMVGRPASFVSVGLLVGLLGLIILASATVGQQDDNPRGPGAPLARSSRSPARTTSSCRSCSASAGSSR